MSITLKKVKKMLRDYDKNLKLGTREYNASLVLMSSAFIGFNENKLAAFTKVPVKQVREFAKNLRASKVWHRGKFYHSGWDDEKSGGIAFALDSCVALGFLKRGK